MTAITHATALPATHRKLLATLTAAALLALSAPAAHAAPPVAIQFVPLGDKAHPDELSFGIPLAIGESVQDIRYQSGGGEASLLASFDLQPGAEGVTARFLPRLDFSPYVGQTLLLRVIKATGFAAQSEESLQLKIVAATDLQQDVKLVAISDGSAAPDGLDFTIPGAVNLVLDDLLLVSAKQAASVKSLFTLAAQRGGDTSASLRGLDLDTQVGQTLELRAAKSFKNGAGTLNQKFLIAAQTASDFTKNAVLSIPTSGDSQPDPFTLDLAAGANVEIQDITLGGSSVLALFDLTRAADGSLGAQLKRAMDFDAMIGQPLTLTLQKTVGGVAYTQKVTAYAQLPTPKLLAKDDGSLSAASGLGSTATVGNLQFVLYGDAAGKTESGRNAKGAFADLTAATDYWLGTVAEASDRAALKSPLLAVKTDSVNPSAFSFYPTSGVGFGSQYTSNAVTVAGFTSKAQISVTGGEYALDGGAWTSAAGTVRAGQSMRVRGTSATSYSTAKTVTLTIGARSGDFVITTMAVPEPPANSAPTGNNSTYGTNVGNTARTFDMKALLGVNDADGDSLTMTRSANGTKGSFAIAGYNVTYTPNANQTGSDTGTFCFNDGHGHNPCWTATVNGIDTQAPTSAPTPSVAAGTYGADQSVTLTPPEAGALMYYTLAGTDPTTASTAYSAAIDIIGGAGATTTKTLKVLTTDALGNARAVDSFVYVIDKLKPTTTADLADNSVWNTDKTLTFSSNEAGTTWYNYSVNGGAASNYVQGTSVNLTANNGEEKTYVVQYYSKDSVNNTEVLKNVTVKIDKLAPTISGSTSGKWVVGGAGGPAAIILTTGNNYVDTLTYSENVTLGASSCTDAGMGMVVAQIAATQVQVTFTRNSNSFGACQVNTTDAAGNAATHSVQTDD